MNKLENARCEVCLASSIDVVDLRSLDICADCLRKALDLLEGPPVGIVDNATARALASDVFEVKLTAYWRPAPIYNAVIPDLDEDPGEEP